MNIARPVVDVEPTKGVAFDLSEDVDYRFPTTDFDDCRFSGKLLRPSTSFSGNFRSCTLQNLHCEHVKFAGADLLDCQIGASTFTACDFEMSHMTGCILRRVLISGARITNINFSQNVFQDVIFENCIFDTFVFKNSRFYDCEFRNCETKNHTFDTCFFDQTKISDFNVFPSTILMNVGLRIEDFDNAAYYSDREIVGGVEVAEIEYISKISQAAFGLQEKVSVAIFASTDTVSLVEQMTTILASNDHVSSAVSRGFIEKLDILVSVLNLLYAENRILALNLLQFQDYLNSLSAHLAGHPDKLTTQFRSQIDSLRFINSEFAAQIIQVLELAYDSLRGARLVALMGSDELSLTDFQQLLSDHSGIKVIETRPRQSPVAVFVELLEAGALVWLVSAIITTRFRYQITDNKLLTDEQDGALRELHKKLPSDLDESDSAVPAPIRTNWKLELGLISRQSMDVGIRVASAFQGGLVKKFELSISPKRAVEFQKSLLGLIGSYGRADK